jgi:hypothetical protein
MKINPEWWQYVQAWRESGMSQADYCRQQGLNPKTFSKWARCEYPVGPSVHHRIGLPVRANHTPLPERERHRPELELHSPDYGRPMPSHGQFSARRRASEPCMSAKPPAPSPSNWLFIVP